MPFCLKPHYRAELIDRGLLDDALRDLKRIGIGGISDEDTKKHFYSAFSSSVGRVTYATVAPHPALADASDLILQIFSFGHVAVLDIPSGTGALSAGLLALLIDLRNEHLLPKLPLTLTFCAGDFSPLSLDIYDSVMLRLRVQALAVGIQVQWRPLPWDATNGAETARLVHNWLSLSNGATEHVVFVTNFSGALEEPDTFTKFDYCFHNILSSLVDKQGAVLWVEPIPKKTKPKLGRNLVNAILRYTWWKGTRDSEEPERPKATYRIAHPLDQRTFDSSVMLQYFSPFAKETE